MFGIKREIITDEKKIDEILARSVNTILPSKEELKKVLTSGKRLKIYHGADATGKDLHLGHSTNFLILERLRQLGHEVVVLFGDFTARIGDPTDKSAARVRLTKKEVEANLRSWKKQISKIINFKDSKNSVKIVRNSKWLAKLNFEDLIELSTNFTVQQMLERDMFQKRMEEGKPIYLHEFYYPLMQGYDSVAIDVDMEIGGTDQTFNMLAGRILQKKLNNRDKFVLTTGLLENPKTGNKLMNKSEGNYVSLQDTPNDMFGKIMALPDEIVIQMFMDTTNKELSEIQKIEQGLNDLSIHPKDAKKQLAEEIVTIYHSEREAKKAEENFDNTFSKREIPEDVLEISTEKETKLSDILLSEKVVESKNEWRRLVEQGGVTSMKSGEKIKDSNYVVSGSGAYKIGKKRFIKIKV